MIEFRQKQLLERLNPPQPLQQAPNPKELFLNREIHSAASRNQKKDGQDEQDEQDEQD
ncbi:MAG: hypothetical protein ABSH38_14910 [Verrucomicrobiota bacterium]|jgi:hypothetical protein